MPKILRLMALGALCMGLASGTFAQDNIPKPVASSQDPKPGAYGLTYVPNPAGQASLSHTAGEISRLGRSAPALSFVRSDGTRAGTPSSAAGHLTLIDFWATWCGPCRRALPGVKRLVSEYHDQVEVVSINEDKDENAWRSFIDRNQMTWIQQFDGNGAMARRYGVSAFPTYILLDSSGKVISQFAGDDPSLSLVDRLGPEIRNALSGKF